MEEILNEILDDLLDLEADIPNDIRTGYPESIRSANVRSIHERTNDIVTRLTELIKDIVQNNRGLSEGLNNPNVDSPSDPVLRDVYIQRNNKGVILEYWVYTGKPSPFSWIPIKNWEADVAEKYYGDIANPNTESIPLPPGPILLNPFKIGDLYIQTSTGDESGNVQSVWLFLKLHSGNQWLRLEKSESSAVLFSNQNLTAAQIRQVKLNLGWIEINGNLFELKKNPSNDLSSKVPQLGDLAINGWIDANKFGKLLIYKSGNPTLITSWEIAEEY